MDKQHTTVVQPARQARPAGGSLAIIIILAIVVGIGGFVGGMQYQKGRTTSTSTTASRQGFGGPGGMSQNGSMGSVTAISASSISVSDQRSSSTKTYAITSATKISDNGSTASYNDIAVGDRVFVMTASSSSTDATQIQVNPTMGGPNGQSSTQPTQTNSSSTGTTST